MWLGAPAVNRRRQLGKSITSTPGEIARRARRSTEGGIYEMTLDDDLHYSSASTGGSTVRGDPDRLDSPVRRARSEWRVALVSMPFVAHFRPSIQLGLLKAIASSYPGLFTR